MVSNDLNQKYTIEKYRTRFEVAKAIGTNLIDPLWKEISEFRKRLSIDLPIFDTFHQHYSLTYIDSVQGKSSELNDRVSRFVNHYAQLTEGSIAKYTFSHDMLKLALKGIAKVNRIDASEITLTKITDNKDVENEYLPLVRYQKALIELKNNPFDELSEDFLAKYYAILRGEVELTSFYRVADNETASSRALVDRDYDQGVPAHLIDEMMASLMQYITNFDISLGSRLAAIFFMFNYIKPFESHNMELASLLAKRVIAETDIDSASIYIPLESFVNEKDFFGDISKEVKKTHDFTYAFLNAVNRFVEYFDISIDSIIRVHAHALDVEVKLGDNAKKVKEEFGIELEKVKPEPVVTQPRVSVEKQVINTVPKFEETVSEKELKARANDILESDPFIKKGQAHFYVHHCTPGKYYTIQQYVKFEGCVYETGRTSMDNLALRGYYRREQVKNKFVYTPIHKE